MRTRFASHARQCRRQNPREIPRRACMLVVVGRHAARATFVLPKPVPHFGCYGIIDTVFVNMQTQRNCITVFIREQRCRNSSLVNGLRKLQCGGQRGHLACSRRGEVALPGVSAQRPVHLQTVAHSREEMDRRTPAKSKAPRTSRRRSTSSGRARLATGLRSCEFQ